MEVILTAVLITMLTPMVVVAAGQGPITYPVATHTVAIPIHRSRHQPQEHLWRTRLAAYTLVLGILAIIGTQVETHAVK